MGMISFYASSISLRIISQQISSHSPIRYMTDTLYTMQQPLFFHKGRFRYAAFTLSLFHSLKLPPAAQTLP